MVVSVLLLAGLATTGSAGFKPASATDAATSAKVVGTDTPGVNPDSYTCNQSGYIDFENLPDAFNLSAGSIGGVQFTTTNGYTWLVGDFSTGAYNGKYPNGGYTSQGSRWAWLGPNEGAGRIDFVMGPVSVFSLLVSGNTPVQLDAYNSANHLLAAAGPILSNYNTGKVDELAVVSGSANISYVIVHDDGNFFDIDSICTNAKAVQPPITRYVALGDSVPYGHGLANPGKEPQGTLSTNMGPSDQAYPSVIASVLGVNFSLRNAGCTLGGDNVAVSGAPSIQNQWTGFDDDCHYKGPVPAHKAVDPNELVAANLAKDPPQLVTLQVGADDIDFAACLTHLLGIPALPFTGSFNCVMIDRKTGGYFLPTRVMTELQSLKTGLDSILKLVHTEDPGATIVVVDYYQPFPSASETLVGSSVVCDLLKAETPGALAGNRAQADFLQDALNGVISSEAKSFSYVRFVDITNLFDGHEMCVADPSSPNTSVSWVFDGQWDGAHPTATGQMKIGDAVLPAT